jgi:hypothetical protein
LGLKKLDVCSGKKVNSRPDIVIHICKASMREAEAGGSLIQGQLSYIASP